MYYIYIYEDFSGWSYGIYKEQHSANFPKLTSYKFIQYIMYTLFKQIMRYVVMSVLENRTLFFQNIFNKKSSEKYILNDLITNFKC